jgi:hypothetical protein
MLSKASGKYFSEGSLSFITSVSYCQWVIVMTITHWSDEWWVSFTENVGDAFGDARIAKASSKQFQWREPPPPPDADDFWSLEQMISVSEFLQVTTLTCIEGAFSEWLQWMMKDSANDQWFSKWWMISLSGVNWRQQWSSKWHMTNDAR